VHTGRGGAARRGFDADGRERRGARWRRRTRAQGVGRRPSGKSGPVRDAETVITPYRDGPLLVRGPFRLETQDGEEIEVGRRTVALCRCGKSRLRPFCDGTHKLVRFSAPSEAERRA